MLRNRMVLMLSTAVVFLLTLSLVACAAPEPTPLPTAVVLEEALEEEALEEEALLPLRPFRSEVAGIMMSGVAPEAWDEFTAGTFMRDYEGGDRTALVHQVVGNQASAEDFLSLFASGVGLDVSAAVSETVSLDGRVWDIYQAEINGRATDIALARDGAFTLFVVMVSQPDEHDLLKEGVLLPALRGMSVP